MKRRRFFQSIAAAAPAAAAAAQYSPSAAGTPATNVIPKLTESAPEAAGDGIRRFFSAEQFAALQHLAGLIVPRMGEVPGAREAEVPVFLDFLLRDSGPERQSLYLAGLDKLNTDAKKRYSKPFAQLTAGEAKPLLEPLTHAWTYAPPTDPFARFLREVKDDLLQATVSSRQYAQAMSRRSRSAAGINAYWLPLD